MNLTTKIKPNPLTITLGWLLLIGCFITINFITFSWAKKISFLWIYISGSIINSIIIGFIMYLIGKLKNGKFN